ncbi:hypothetical protein [Halalkalicoccus jeotgali]|uniref:Uncharacterized protein n=1 Tax=Halalkalicoccus jeotgali (strain DSM 18796 / CECT 7217 / JCM 14584 / KCTC 4019 / B3) TaxID=795797 RepID=L9VLS3_HALJB|nr:hypothetical protein [Halalkalicoccus jeotgali]ELY38155.1 hypothetical protein C497_08594 [Halalkalicoccus jeotgali B3]
MSSVETVNVLIDPPDGQKKPGRVFLERGVFLLAPTRHGPLARTLGAWANGLFAHLPEEIGLYDPFAVTREEARADPGTVRVRYGDVEAMAPVVRPTGFSLHLRVARREDAVRLEFRSNEERRELVTLARAIRDRAREAGRDVGRFDPGGRTRPVSLAE